MQTVGLTFSGSDLTTTQTGSFVYRDNHTVTLTHSASGFTVGHVYRLTIKRKSTDAALASAVCTASSISSNILSIDLNVDDIKDALGALHSISIVADLRDTDDDFTIGKWSSYVFNNVNRSDDTTPTNPDENTYTDDEVDAKVAAAALPSASSTTDYTILTVVSNAWTKVLRATWLGTTLEAIRSLSFTASTLLGQKSTGGIAVLSASEGRTVLELGDSATKSVGTTAGTVAAGDDARMTDERVPSAAGLASTSHAATSKDTPVDADEVPLVDSAATYGLKKLTWANIKATLKVYFDTLYEVASAVSNHAALTTGVHGVGAGTVAKVSDIATDGNLSAAAQAAITASHAKQHAINSSGDHTGYGDSVTKSVGTGAEDVAAGNHTHAAYQPLATLMTAGSRYRATASGVVAEQKCLVALPEAGAGAWSPTLTAGAHHTVTRSGIWTGITPSGLEIGEGCCGSISGAAGTTTTGVTADWSGALDDIAGASVGWVIWREASGYRMACWAKA